MKPKDIKRQDDDDLASLLAHSYGRRFVRRLLATANIGQSGIAENTHNTYFNLGVKHVGLLLERELKERHTRSYVLMVNEEFGDSDPSPNVTVD